MPLHWYDLLILLGVALLFFGPKRLPEMGSAVGKTIKEFQKSMREISEPEKPPTPAALPQADAQVQVAPKMVAPAENTTVSAAPAVEHHSND